MERAAPQELSQKRSRRQIIIRYTLEVFQELKASDEWFPGQRHLDTCNRG